MRKPLRCLVGWHRWHTFEGDEGVRYRVCDRCHEEERPAGLLMAPGIMNPPV